MTRQDYMSGKVTHAEYYRSVYQAAGITWREHPALPQVKGALANGDEHLNTIQLAWWDAQGLTVRESLARAFKAHGDHWSLAGSVCALKQAARDAAEGVAT